MHELVRDPELAAIAQMHTDQCRWNMTALSVRGGQVQGGAEPVHLQADHQESSCALGESCEELV